MALRQFKKAAAVVALSIVAPTWAADEAPLIGLPPVGKEVTVPVPAPTASAKPAAPTTTPPPAPVAAKPVAATPVPEVAPATEAIPFKRVVTPPASMRALSKDDRNFPRYAELEPAVGFWKRVFGEYADTQSVIHCGAYPQVVFTVLDLSDEAERMSPVAFARYRELEEKKAKERYTDLLRQVDHLRDDKSAMSREQRAVYDLFDDIDESHRFRRAADTVRAQRGLRERTRRALDVSARYLPTMEETFRGYDLPVALTRLPLVESSFNIEAYSKVGAAGLWQFIPSSARIYMRLNELVDDRRDPWTSTDAAARHLKDDYAALGSWPLAITAYNYGRGGIARALNTVNGTTLVDLIQRFQSDRFGFASKNYYAEFLGALDVDRDYRKRSGSSDEEPLRFDVVETRHYVPYETLRRLCGADDELFRKLNPAYRPEVIEGRMYVPPKHLIRVPAGSAREFAIGYEKLSSNEKFDSQRMYYLLHRVSHGDSLGKIARNYRTTIAAIVAANGFDSRKHLRVGSVVKIPPHAESRPGPVSAAIGESVPAQTRAQKRQEQVERAKDRKEPKERVHVVKSGQTLGGIAKQYRVSLAALRGANNLDAKAAIKPGMKLKIPTSN